MSESSANIQYQPTPGLSYEPREPVYWDPAGLRAETRRTFEICHGCRLCFKYCDVFPALFALLDQTHGGDVRRITEGETAEVLGACFQCKLCEVQCPYTRREGHPFQLDFPALVHRHAAQRARRRGLRLRDCVLGAPDAVGRLARLSLGLANVANRWRAVRWGLEKTLGIHRDKLLPPFARRSFEAWARRTGRLAAAPGAEAVLFQTCYVQHNAPELGRDTIDVLERNGVGVRCVAGLQCCGMPAWEHGDLGAVRRQAAANLRRLDPFVRAGATVLAINPTCAMMMRREHPALVDPADRPAAERLAAAIRDPAEFLWSIRNEPRFNTAFRSTPGGTIAYHAPCHLRAQAIGFRGRDLVRRIPGVRVSLVQECSGHDGTYAMTVEGFAPSARIGRKAFEGLGDVDARLWATECPLAALQFRQHAGRVALHPMSILARAYREDGFPERLPPAPPAPAGAPAPEEAPA
jgi:Fe-S oxidoreductase